MNPAPIYLAGPTAVGKSALALELARHLDGEIISVDSMQVYRGMDIGTAKPGAEERRQVPHHLIDIVDLSEPFDVAKYVVLAGAAQAGIVARGKRPIFCGGTGFYFKILLEGIGGAPPGDPRLRARLAAVPPEELLRELRERDPEKYATVDRNNLRRVVRAVEVIRLTGIPFSAQKGTPRKSPQEFPVPIIALRREPADLRERIEHRVTEMFARRLVDETRALLDRGLAENPTAMQALGYRQVVEHLRGERSLAETVELVNIRTRQFAKRQMTWFRHQLPVRWVDWRKGAEPADLAGLILSQTPS